MGQIREMARCSDTSSAVVESFDCSVIYLNHTVMSFNDDYAGSNDEGGASCVLKHRPKQNRKKKKLRCPEISRRNVGLTLIKASQPSNKNQPRPFILKDARVFLW